MAEPPWSRAQRREQDRFARAVEGEHHPEFSHELTVVEELRGLGDDRAPDAATRARLDERVLPEPRCPSDAHQRAAGPQGTTAPAGPHGDHGPHDRHRRRVFPMLTAAAVALVLGLAGLGMVLSQDALPGDSLYAVKRASERAALGLTFDDEARAMKRLGHATTRLDEVNVLLERDVSDGTAYATGFADFAADTRTAATELTTLATSSDGHHLDGLRSWADTQTARVAGLHQQLPEHGTDPRALLDQVGQRANALADRMSCSRITSGASDELGALPATGDCQAPGEPPERSPADPPRRASEPPMADMVTNPDAPPTSASTTSARVARATATPATSVTSATSATATAGTPTPTRPVPNAPDTSLPSAETTPLPAPAPASWPRLPSPDPPPEPAIMVRPLVPGLPAVGLG